MDVCATEILCSDHLPSSRFHERWPAEKDGAIALDDHGLVAHGRHIGSSSRARAHHHGNLRDASGRHIRLVVENAAEVVSVREHFVLER